MRARALARVLSWGRLMAWPSLAAESLVRRMPIGAELQPQGGVHFRVWAPKPRNLALHIDGRDLPLRRERGGYFGLYVAEAGTGSRYGYRIDDHSPCAD